MFVFPSEGLSIGNGLSIGDGLSVGDGLVGPYDPPEAPEEDVPDEDA